MKKRFVVKKKVKDNGFKTFDELETEFNLGLHLCANTEYGMAFVYLNNGLMRVVSDRDAWMKSYGYPFWVDGWTEERVWELRRMPKELEEAIA